MAIFEASNSDEVAAWVIPQIELSLGMKVAVVQSEHFTIGQVLFQG
jgi:hypothetical protein